VDALIDSLLQDPEKDVRKEAARSLGRLNAQQARSALSHAARYDSSKRVRKAAEQALRSLRPEPRRPYARWDYRDRRHEALERLLGDLRFGRDSEREDAAEKLGKLGDGRAVPALVDALRNDPEEDVREEAAEALGRIGDRSALPALRWAARHDREDDVRDEARKAIKRITD